MLGGVCDGGPDMRGSTGEGSVENSPEPDVEAELTLVDLNEEPRFP